MPEFITGWLLLFSLTCLLLTSSVFVHNLFYLTELPFFGKIKTPEYVKISVCIPARNEEKSIGRLLESIVSQTHPNFEILILDDQSGDSTSGIIKSFKNQYPDLISLIEGSDMPKGWFGKSWACHQLGVKASGDILLFIDADTVLKPGMLLSVSAAFLYHKPDMITVWPHQILYTWWEKCLIPIVYYTLLTFLPARYSYKKPLFIPQYIYSRISSFFSAANGQCIAFRKKAYQLIDGHRSVKTDIVEDVKLAKKINRAGLSLRMYTGRNTIKCRMYNNHLQIFQGFRKNFFAGFRYNFPFFFLSAAFHFVVFILPFITLPVSFIIENQLWLQLSAAVVSIILLQRVIIAFWQQWNPFYSFTHPIGVIWFQFLALTTVCDYVKKRKVKWKEREILTSD